MTTKDEVCPSCERQFKRLGTHWARSDCEYPVPSAETDEVLTGIFMGDGNLAAHHSENPYLRWNNVNKRFMDYVHEKLKPITTSVKLRKTAEESHEYNENRSDRNWTVNPENYNDIYLTRTRRLPYFRKFKDWYTEDGKRFPDTLELTPTIAKYWYVCDGTVNWMRNYSAKVQFTSKNEADREEFIIDLFDRAGFTVKRNRHMYYFSVSESKSILDWMGAPLPGFEYKWELDSRSKYHQKKNGTIARSSS